MDNIIDVNDDKNEVYENTLFVNSEDEVEDFIEINLYLHLPAREELRVSTFQSSVIHSHPEDYKATRECPSIHTSLIFLVNL
jgi:hypothetical protein